MKAITRAIGATAKTGAWIGAALACAALAACKHDEAASTASSDAAAPTAPSTANALAAQLASAASADPSAPAPAANDAAVAATPDGAPFEGTVDMRIEIRQLGERATKMTYFVKGDHVRVDIVPDAAGGPSPFPPARMVLDTKTKKMVTLFDAQKMYVTMDTDEAERQVAKIDAGTPEATDTGKTDAVAGKTCELWTTRFAGMNAELCVAKGMRFVAQGSLKSFSFLGSGGPAGLREAFPLRAIVRDPSGEVMRMVATKIDAKTLDDAVFAIPAGYKEQPMPNLGGLGAAAPGAMGMGGAAGLGGAPRPSTIRPKSK